MPQTFTSQFVHRWKHRENTILNFILKHSSFPLTGENENTEVYIDNVSLVREPPADPNLAHSPLPADGTFHDATWAVIWWTPGRHAALHDVYFGDNFEDVNNSRDHTYFGTLHTDMTIVGFPDIPSVDGLIPGTTYYWRIDEVNELHPDSPWRGDVCSFTIAPRTAYDPVPADGNDLVDPNVALNWTAGMGARSHTVYFGETFEDVNNTTGGLPQGATTYSPGPLGLGKTYYWRVDEFDGWFTHKGAVWSFTTVPLKASNPDPPDGAMHENLWVVLSWSPGYYAGSHDLYISRNRDEVAKGLHNAYGGNYSTASTIIGFCDYTGWSMGLMEPGAKIYWRVDEVNDVHPDSPWEGDVWNFRIPPVTAYDPVPGNGADSVDPDVTLSWTAGFGARLHTVYFGDNFDDVNTAAGGFPQETTTYTPGLLELGKTYYWRVDQFDGLVTAKGEVWSFTVVSQA